MTDRISKLTEFTLTGNMYVHQIKTEYDRLDLFLPQHEKDVKRICEYMLNQQPKLTKYSAFTGFFNFDNSVVGDIFNRIGHKNTDELMGDFFLKPIENLSTMDWQHATSDYRKVLSIGIFGIIDEIEMHLSVHTDIEKIQFLKCLKKIAETFVLWIKKCSEITYDFAQKIDEPIYKGNLEKLSKALEYISDNPPSNFYEALLTIYVCFSLNPDSFGTLDRYLTPFYDKDIKNGVLTPNEAKEYLQELFLMVQAATPFTTSNFTKGGQSHFCVGGRDEFGKDCYNQVSELILESLIELPTFVPEVTLRWTNDTPKEVFRHVLKCEKRDINKRIAFTNDDKRIEAYTKICGFPYKNAVNYTLVGCNEPAMLGGMCASSSHANMAHSIETVLHSRADEVIKSATFEEFYDVFKKQLYADLDKIYYYDDMINLQRAKDINYVSCLFFNGCIENGKSITQGGVNYAISNVMFLGNINVIDSLAIIKQFVFDEKIIPMDVMITALNSNWEGYDKLHSQIKKTGAFFGNDDPISNHVATLFYDDLYEYIKEKRTVLGYPVLIGDHTGYQMHFKWFGEHTKATPDGRFAGEPLSYGIFQSGEKCRNGITALMNSISNFDRHGISSATVTNFTLDNSYVKNEEYFDKTVDMLETYFKNGGIQFQLNYMSKADLLNAKQTPEKYQNLRVRVTGYSDYYTRLSEPTQDSIINRFN